jgi:hypothetical protein
MARSSDATASQIILRFCLSTLPFFAVLVYLLFTAVQRGNAEGNQVEDDLFSLMDILFIFLAFYIFWTVYAVYFLIFVPKRRYLLDRYLRDGEKTAGDIIVEDTTKRTGLRCKASRQYGYAIYSHPTKTDPQVLVRKKVRVYQPYTRERVEILRLPNRPLSGQAKIDIEIDLSKMRTERNTTLSYFSAASVFWILFSLVGAGFCVFQMTVLPEQLLMEDENPLIARRIIFFVAGITPFFALGVNGIRYLMYYRWMVHTGASITDEDAARNVKTNNWCLYNDDAAASFDGSDQIPYSILGEDRSFAGTVQSHSRSVLTAPEETEGKQVTVTSVEDDGAKVKALPWTNV